MRFDLSEGFPLLTTKRVHLKSIIHELLWFVKGDTNIKYLVDNDVRIWNEWPYEKFKKSEEYNNETLEEFVLKIRCDQSFADKYGDLGPVYGHQWRNFNSQEIDQIRDVIERIKKNPQDRRYPWQSLLPFYSRSSPYLFDAPCHNNRRLQDKNSLGLYTAYPSMHLPAKPAHLQGGDMQRNICIWILSL